jgi:hypothetical protein
MVSALAEMWLAAAKDLGFRVSAPFLLDVESGLPLEFDALVHDFGSDKGTVLMAKWDPEKADAVAAQGFGYSCMRARDYDREYVIEVLMDWGWCGPEAASPEWLRAAT